MFTELPGPVVRFLFGRILNELLAEIESTESWRVLFPVMSLMVSPADTSLCMSDRINFGDQLHARMTDCISNLL